MGFLVDKTVFYADNLFGKSYCYYLEDSKADVVCAFTVSNASIFTKYLPNARKKKVGKHVPHVKQDLILCLARKSKKKYIVVSCQMSH